VDFSPSSRGGKGRYKPGELFSGIVFLMTSLDDTARVTLTAQISKHGGKVMPTIQTVDNLLRKNKARKPPQQAPIIMVLSEASGNAHRRAKYQYGLALGNTPIHYSWAVDCIRAKEIIFPQDAYRLPIGMNLSTGLVEFNLLENPVTPMPKVFDGLNIVVLLREAEVVEWASVLSTAGANVVPCPHLNITSDFLSKHNINMIIAKGNDLLTGTRIRPSIRNFGLDIATFDWVFQCLLQKDRIGVHTHVSFTVGERNVSEKIWVKKNNNNIDASFERATVMTSDNGQYKVTFEDGSDAVLPESHILHPNETRPDNVNALFAGPSHASEDAIRRGGDLEYATVTLYEKNYNLGDTCMMRDGRIGTIERLFASEGKERMRWRLLRRGEDDEEEEENEVFETDEIVETSPNLLSATKVLLMKPDDYAKALWSSTSETEQQKIMFYNKL
tara:strand:- start:143 stop:1474 length:1332 start_codon:yes stop_codon:yes gene_type:complete